MMSKIDIEITPWLSDDGVLSSLWFGTIGEPAYEETVPYEQLVDQTLESYAPFGVIRKVDYEDAERVVKSLEQMAYYARAQLEKLSEE